MEDTPQHHQIPSPLLSNIIHRPILEIIISARDVFSFSLSLSISLCHTYTLSWYCSVVRGYMFVSVFAYVKNVRRHCHRCFLFYIACYSRAIADENIINEYKSHFITKELNLPHFCVAISIIIIKMILL